MRTATPVQKSVMLDLICRCLASIPIFSKLTEAELKYVAGHMHVHKLSKDTVVFREGDAGDYICFVVDGILDVYKTSANGGDPPIATLREGSSIGEMAVIDDFPRSATVNARTETTMVTLSRERLDFIADSFPQVGIKVLKELARLMSLNLRQTSDHLSDMLQSPVRQRSKPFRA